MWITKSKLKKENSELLNQLANYSRMYTEVCNENIALTKDLDAYIAKYPFEMGQVLYDVQLRSAKGRFTKTKASREHSYINEVVVDKKNYFNLVDRYHSSDVFTTQKAAENFLDSVCVE